LFALSFLFLGAFHLSALGESAKIALYYSGEIQGNYRPCGCKAGPAGGLARRAGMVSSCSAKTSIPAINVDLGNYFQSPGPYADRVNTLMIESLATLPMRIMNLGSEDLIWWKQLSSLELPETRFISTNLVPRRAGLPPPERYAITQLDPAETGLARPLRIGFLGITEPRLVKPNSGFRALDPVKAIAEVREEIISQVDFLVVLADWIRPQSSVPEDWPITAIAKENPEVYAILLTERRFVFYKPLQAGSATILSSIERCRYLGQLILGFDEKGKVVSIENNFLNLGDGAPEDQRLLEKEKRLSRIVPD
jgi:2',3'-cyclic-nucleotide 2'-phosphodiesterase (5'-nucleotidase family)